jgi:S1-C subfamily serine protease
MAEPTLTRRGVLAAAGASLAGCAGTERTTPVQSGTNETDTAAESTPDSATPESPYTRVYRETIDGVVLVQPSQGQGTGFAYDSSHVVTNAHVVGTESEAEIRFQTGEWTTGTVVGTDPHSDLAVLDVGSLPTGVEPLSLADGQPEIGQEVVAIGNPYDLNGTVTTGIVSGVNRAIPAQTGFTIPDAIQTDAAVNPGNSGGPLVALDGDVVAVINSGGGDNIAFGISAALTARVVPSIIETGAYDHAYLGVSLAPVTPTIAAANDLSEPRGLLVVDTVAGGPSDGILQPSTDTELIDGRQVPAGGDVVTAIDDEPVQTTEDLGSHLALQKRPGETTTLRVRRDGESTTVVVRLGVRPTR